MDPHGTIKVTRNVTFHYTLRPGAYPGASNEDVFKHESDYYIDDIARALRYRDSDEVESSVSFEVLDN